MSRVKSHFRHLHNGQLVRVHEYTDKRTKAQAKAKAGQLVHADETSTTIANHKGEVKTYPHDGEMTKQAIHAHLNKPLPVNADLAHQVVKHQLGIKDHNQFLADAVEEEGYKQKPRFQDVKGAAQWFHDTHTAPKLKELRQAHGKTTTRAKAALHKHPDLKAMWADHADDKDASAHEQAEGAMVGDHAEDAHAEAEQAMEQGAKAKGKGPKDAPQVPAITPDIKFFGHQAQALAQMNVLDNCITDVDMGGGKGLILPADALALMGQGKVKKPLVVVPGATLDQNADLLADKYSKGGVNVFKISSETIAKHYGGDIEKVVADIKSAPPNTVFMASYDAIGHQDQEGAPERFPHAAALGAAGFDYLACDECHNVRNEESARFQALTHLGGAKYKRMASGTFLANDPRDVVGPMKLLYPGSDIDQKKLEQFYGRKESGGEATWSPHGLKKLREHLLDLGMVSLRRSAWMDKLPKRQDKLSVMQMLPQQRRVHDAVLHDVLEQLETDSKDNPLMARALADDSLDNAWEAPPALMRKLELLQGVTDYPDEMARMVEGKLTLASGNKADPEAQEAMAELQKLSASARNAMLSLKGMVSPKALDVYAKAKAHLGKAGNGKFIVFVQRKAAAEHLMRNMPEELKKHEPMYFDASKMEDLPKFTDGEGGPRLLIAVDASIKEGVNMQEANGLYRYDHHLTPGNQEQSYARIWRFGQKRPTDIHLGIMDGGMDVTKYARLCSKNWVNQQVVSDFESDKSTPIYKLSVKNLKEKRDANILDDYHGLNEEILDWQRGENKKYKTKYGDQPYALATGKPIAGGKAGSGKAYHKAKLKKSRDVFDELGDAIESVRADLAKQGGWDLSPLRRPTPNLDTWLGSPVEIPGILKAGKLWTYRQPKHVHEAFDGIGDKVTNLAPEKLPRFQEIVQDSLKNRDSEERLARRLRSMANAGGGGDARDWGRVARTEMSNARAAGALAHIILEYGKDALVQRKAWNCCGVCANAFGKYVQRKWRAGSIPPKYVGSVHPNCKCGPWKLVNPLKRRSMSKAINGERVVSMGIVRRVKAAHGWNYDISTGYGSWVALDTITARTIMRGVLARTPLVLQAGGDGFGGHGWAKIGHGKVSGVATLLDPAAVTGALYFTELPDASDTKYVIRAKTRDQYVEVMLQILPVVMTMPEPWMSPDGSTIAYRDLASFMGHKSLTDWWCRLPKGQPPESVLAVERTAPGSARDLVRRWTKQLMHNDTVAKG